MFRLAKFLIPLGIGAAFGWNYHDTVAQNRCSALGGGWTEGICLKAQETTE